MSRRQLTAGHRSSLWCNNQISTHQTHTAAAVIVRNQIYARDKCCVCEYGICGVQGRTNLWLATEYIVCYYMVCQRANQYYKAPNRNLFRIVRVYRLSRVEVLLFAYINEYLIISINMLYINFITFEKKQFIRN